MLSTGDSATNSAEETISSSSSTTSIAVEIDSVSE